MKKLLFWAALLTTGFAFYSCDDVVDNPAQDPASVWNYSVSVKFDAFNFDGIQDENGDPYTYNAPTTLFVFDENYKEMGTITAEAAPAAGDYGTYAGTISGAIGDSLVISTSDPKNFVLQDGTMEAAIKYGLIQAAKVPIKIYNANSQKITTGSASLKNAVSIMRFFPGAEIIGKQTITISDDNLNIPGLTEKSFNLTLKEGYKNWTQDPATSAWTQHFIYIALAAPNTEPIAKIDFESVETDTKLTGEIKIPNYVPGGGAYKALNIGGISYPDGNLDYASIDLTKYWAKYKADNPDANNCWITTGYKGAKIFQSDSKKAVPASLTINNDATLSGVNIGGDANWNWLGVNINANQDITNLTLEGDNVINFEKSYNKGLNCYGGHVKINGNGASLTASSNQGAIYVQSGNETTHNKLTIGEGVTINANLPENGTQYAIEIQPNADLIIEKGATVNAKALPDNSYGMFLFWDTILKIGGADGSKAIVNATGGKESNAYGLYIRGEVDIENAEITATTGKGGIALEINNGDKNITIGKDVTINANGALYSADNREHGMRINSTGTLKMDANSTINASIEDGWYALKIENATLDLAEKATISAKLTGERSDGNAFIVDNVTVKGKGTITAESTNKSHGMWINSLSFEGGSLDVTAGTNTYGIGVDNATAFVIKNTEDFKQVKVTSKDTNDTPICIFNQTTWAELAKFDATKFEDKTDTTGKIRTITPKPAEE